MGYVLNVLPQDFKWFMPILITIFQENDDIRSSTQMLGSYDWKVYLTWVN